MLLATTATLGAATAVLIASWRCTEEDRGSIARLGQANVIANVLELAVFAGFALTFKSPEGLAFIRWPGVLIPLFVVPVGLMLPLVIGEVDAALLTLFGGFVLCLALVGIPASISLR